MGEIDIKKIIIAIVLVIVVVVGVFFGIKGIAGSGKKYQLEEIKESDYKFFAVYEEEKYGVINEKGEKIIDNIYTDIIIPNPSKAVFICQKEDGEKEILNDKCEKIFSEYKNVQAIETNGIKTELPYEKSVLRYEEEGKFGIINFEGKAITKPIYEEVASVKNKEGEILAKKNGKYGVINNKGKILISFEYEEIEGDKYYSNGNYQKSGYIVKIENSDGYQYGYINDKWKKVLKPEYSGINRITEIEGEDTYLAAAKNGQYALIRNKKPQTDFVYQSILYNKDTETLAVQRGEKYGVINLQGEQIIPIQYKGIRYNGTYICAKTYEEDLYFNTKGENLQTGYIGMKPVKDLNIFITTNEENLYGLMDENGKVIVDNTYLYIDYAFDKYFVAYKEGEGHGVIDKAGNKMVEFEYDVLSKVGEKNLLKAVKMQKDGDETVIFSKDLVKLMAMKNMSINIEENYIEVYNNEERIFINNDGEVKTAKDLFKGNKLYAVSNNGKWGFEDKEGVPVVVGIYDYVTEFNKYGFAGVRTKDKWAVIDETGKLITESIFYFGEGNVKPEFLGKYYKTYRENGELYYTNQVDEDAYNDGGL